LSIKYLQNLSLDPHINAVNIQPHIIYKKYAQPPDLHPMMKQQDVPDLWGAKLPEPGHGTEATGLNVRETFNLVPLIELVEHVNPRLGHGDWQED
jgi:hypothetical protein